jgi:hypothetical protein
MIKVMISIEETPQGALDMDMQAVPFPPCTQVEGEASAVVRTALEAMSELMLSNSKDGRLLAEDDIRHRVKGSIEDFWDGLCTR